jgi:hypothetical protein
LRLTSDENRPEDRTDKNPNPVADDGNHSERYEDANQDFHGILQTALTTRGDVGV